MGGVAGVVLDVQLTGDAELTGEVVRLDQLGETRVQAGQVRHVRGDGQQRGIAPDAVRTGLDPPAQLLRVAGRQLVRDLERPETDLTREDRAQIEPLTALPAGQCDGGTEGTGGVGGGGSS
ncbi:hypothetical protein GCM10017744_057540 [Streptomyces antimycoticus]